jgi:ABC-type sugar transport system permease subunit
VKEDRLAYIYLAPAAVWLILFMGYPILDVVKTSLYHTSYKGERFVGLENFVHLATDDLLHLVLKNTAIWTLCGVVLNVGFGLGVGLLLNKKTRVNEVLRTGLILAWSTPLVVAAITWKWMLNGEYGQLNSLLLSVHLIEEPVQWLTGANTAFAGGMVARLWTALPFTTFAFLSALQTVPDELYEASVIDGASNWQQFRHVTLPTIRPVTLAVLLISVIWSFNSFIFVYVITGGGPANQTQILVTEIFRRAFGYFNFGEASALTLLAFGVLLVVSLLQWRFLYRREI